MIRGWDGAFESSSAHSNSVNGHSTRLARRALTKVQMEAVWTAVAHYFDRPFDRSGLAPEELEEMAAQYEQRAEADRDRLRRVILYAQTALCRWKAILDYFGESQAVDWNDRGDRCGVCDNCGRPIAEPVVTADRPAVRPPRAEPEVLPLPPILGEKDPSTLRPGDTLTLPIFGAGEVREAGEGSLVVAFTDGEVREFRR